MYLRMVNPYFMQEAFLHHLWQYALFSTPLMLTDGSVVEVVNVGIQNNDSGPDFFNARIRIGETVWAGNVEIHVKASDWYKHHHNNDDAYDNIILHVVAENDAAIERKNGDLIPTTVISCGKGIYEQYLYLMQSNSWIPCESFLNKIDDFTIFGWKETLMIERLKTKAMVIEKRWEMNNKDYNETFYQTLAANFGFKVNAVPFEMLAKQLPLAYLLKHSDNLLVVEAMLFGVSGLLPETSNDEYTTSLIREFKHMQNKFGLKTLNKHLWKYSKLRPSNFPNIRIAQFARLFVNSRNLLSRVLEIERIDEVRAVFNIHASEYWDTHYSFGKDAQKQQKRLGDVAFQNIAINTLAPYFVFYSKNKNMPEFTDKAINWLMEIEAENNNIIRHWQGLGMEVKNAFDSQSLIQLKNLYCNVRRCLHCRIGNQVIQHSF